jgi:hypothetical protein
MGRNITYHHHLATRRPTTKNCDAHHTISGWVWYSTPIDNRRAGMDNFTAVGVAEGFIEAESEEQLIEAWQHLHTTRLAYSLQGWFGRTAQAMLAEGLIS